VSPEAAGCGASLRIPDLGEFVEAQAMRSCLFQLLARVIGAPSKSRKNEVSTDKIQAAAPRRNFFRLWALRCRAGGGNYGKH
jgi:hypothetical protein